MHTLQIANQVTMIDGLLSCVTDAGVSADVHVSSMLMHPGHCVPPPPPLAATTPLTTPGCTAGQQQQQQQQLQQLQVQHPESSNHHMPPSSAPAVTTTSTKCLQYNQNVSFSSLIKAFKLSIQKYWAEILGRLKMQNWKMQDVLRFQVCQIPVVHFPVLLF